MENIKNLEFNEIVKRIRKEIRETYKGHKVSVVKDYYNHINIDIDDGYTRENGILDRAREIVKRYNYDNSDAMTDYFDTNFYYTINGTI